MAWRSALNLRLLCGTLLVIGIHAGRADGAGREAREMERLGRGVVAIPTERGKVFVGWRLLGTEPQDVAFNVYLSAGGGAPVKLNAQPLRGPTHLINGAAAPTVANEYRVRMVAARREETPGGAFMLPANAPVRPYLAIPLRTIDGTRPMMPWWVTSTAMANTRSWCTRRDGRDNSQAGVTGEPILDAYRLDGKFLWRINLGRNIREGAHYVPFIV